MRQAEFHVGAGALVHRVGRCRGRASLPFRGNAHRCSRRVAQCLTRVYHTAWPSKGWHSWAFVSGALQADRLWMCFMQLCIRARDRGKPCGFAPHHRAYGSVHGGREVALTAPNKDGRPSDLR
jgi:hypothetical protein